MNVYIQTLDSTGKLLMMRAAASMGQALMIIRIKHGLHPELTHRAVDPNNGKWAEYRSCDFDNRRNNNG